jgi:hypothetical protein
MKKFKLLGAAVSASLAFSMISAVAPAAAAQAILFPPNANGTDYSGFEIFACESGIHMSFPSTPSTEYPALEWQSEYMNQYWVIDDNANEFGDEIRIDRSDDFFNVTDRQQLNFENAISPGTTFNLKLKMGFYDYEIFDNVYADYISIPVTVQDSDAFAGGQGTKADPYLISTVNQLNLVRCHENKYFKLINNLNMAGVDWNPIGQGGSSNERAVNPWRGNFDGNGKIISNLTVDSESRRVGLFGDIQHSDISNLTLRNPNVTGTADVGALSGSAIFSSISNVKIVNGRVTAHEYAGLLVGYIDYRGHFSDISVEGTLSAFPLVIFERTEDRSAISLYGPRRFGGVIGYDDADGTSWSNIQTDTRIEAVQFSEYELNLLESTETYNDIRPVEGFGGFSGEMGEGATLDNLKNKFEINLGFEFPMHHREIAGVFGDMEESLYQNIVSEVSINIDGKNSYSDIGGFSGDADSASVVNVTSKSVINVEVGCSFYPWEEDSCDTSRKIAGFVSDGDDTGYSDINSDSKITIVYLDDRAYLEDVGGFVGRDDESNFQRIISKTKLNVKKANPSNNSLEIDGSSFVDAELASTGGFAGERDDYSQYRAISSTASINVDLPNVTNIGGLVGYSQDNHTMPVHDVVVVGSINLSDSDDSSIGALVGRSGPVNLRNVILSVNVNGDAPKIIGAEHDDYYEDYQLGDGAARSRINNSFFNSDLLDSQTEFPLSARTGKQLKSAKFLKANGFDLTNIYNHQEGQFPVVKINVPFAAGSTGTAVRAGQSNGDTSISFGKLLSGGSRNYFVNLRNADARKVASLVVIRNGKVVKTIASSVTNGVGNYAAASTYKLKAGDVLQVRISGKVVKTIASSVTNGVGNYAAASTYKLKAGDVLQVRISGKVVSTLQVG